MAPVPYNHHHQLLLISQSHFTHVSIIMLFFRHLAYMEMKKSAYASIESLGCLKENQYATEHSKFLHASSMACNACLLLLYKQISMVTVIHIRVIHMFFHKCTLYCSHACFHTCISHCYFSLYSYLQDVTFSVLSVSYTVLFSSEHL